MNNFFISYDLNSPGQNYDKVTAAIKNLGNWAKLQKSLFYVKASLSAQEAFNRVRAVMDQNDSLVVVNATNNDAIWINVPADAAKHVQDFWHK